MKDKKIAKNIVIQILLVVILCAVLFSVWFSNVRRLKQESIDLKSRYTYSQVVNANSSLEEMSRKWINGFTSQFTQRFIQCSQALSNIKIDEIEVLDEENNIVLINFSAQQVNSSSEYFSSWEGILNRGRTIFEWVVTFDTYEIDGKTYISASNIQHSEDYGLETFNSEQATASEATSGDEAATLNQDESIYTYSIRNQVLYVSYDGGNRLITVPVDYEYIVGNRQDKTTIEPDGYVISNEKTAFLYGGNTINGTFVPLTLIYSDDKGNNWISAQVSDIHNVDYYYVNFTTKQNGIIVVGYNRTASQQPTIIYTTEDSGENWKVLGSGPNNNLINEVKFMDNNIGFFSYQHTSGINCNLYMTRDGGKTFSEVYLENQQLDSVDSNNSNQSNRLQWEDVFVLAQVPVVDKDGNWIIYVTQGSNGVYNGGKTVAVYTSSNKGESWSYKEQIEEKDMAK